MALLEATVRWTGGMAFDGISGDHRVVLDSKSPMGKDAGFTPKELVAVGLAGCAAMDVVSLLKKNGQKVDALETSVSIESNSGSYPVVFKKIAMTFKLSGAIDPEQALEAARLSQTKYCGVSAMINETATIDYIVEIDGRGIGSGRTEFPK